MVQQQTAIARGEQRPFGGDLLTHEYRGAQAGQVLRSTRAEYRTVTIINRAYSLRTLLRQRIDLVSSTLATLSDDLAEFVAHPAPTPPELEPGTTT